MDLCRGVCVLFVIDDCSGAALRGLQLLVNNPPVTLKENQPKEAAAEVAVRALSLIKDADMSKALNELSDDQLNNCLKYVYWGLSTGQNSASMLKWHASLVDKLGVGSICRVLSEKKVADNKILA